uniref:NAD dependent epimerase/dehydratase n=1 Tax=Pithovirus LCPAC001 TaxID=2506585 RepID=A0A481Z2R9_9VIRU|nr:MAG: NAD dependent epimerase/dehydratase [Pithovirus LCPAC001]
MRILIFGTTGWIGSKLTKLLKRNHLVVSKVRLDDFDHLTSYLDSVTKKEKITHVLMSAGITGKPTVDFCEDVKNRDSVIAVNILGTALVGKFCYNNDIHFTYMGTGCIYEYDKDHTVDGKGYKEEDKPNFTGSFYSYTKIMTENILKEYNALILRIRMPLSDDLHPRNFITKIISYKFIVNIPNSMTNLSELLPVTVKMMETNKVGVFNFTNPGNISHNQILDLYIKYIDPDFKYTNFSLEDQSKILKAGRSNNTLDSSKLVALYPEIPHISKSIVELFKRMQINLKF